MRFGADGLAVGGVTGAGQLIPVLNTFSVAHTSLAASTEMEQVKFDMSATQTWATGALTTQRFERNLRPTIAFASASVCTTCTLASFEGAPSAGTNATITNAINLLAGGATTQVSASGLTINQINVPAATATITGNTQVTAASGAVHIGVQTLSAASAMTWNTYASLYVAGPPVGGGAGPLTLTGAYAIWANAGTTRLDGLVDISAIAAGSDNLKFTKTNATPAVTYTAHVASTDPQGYIQINDGSGTVAYIPYYR